MTAESVPPGSLHGWSIYLQASEEARRRGDRRVGTDHILLALFEDPSIETVLGVSLQRARQALDSLDHEALAAIGLGSGADAPVLPMRAVPKKPRFRDVAKGTVFEWRPRQRKSSRRGRQAQPSEGLGSRPSRCWPRFLTSSHLILRRRFWVLSA